MLSRRKTRINKLHQLPAKRAPQRTCVACRQVKDKKELVRLVRTPAGNVELDKAGKKEGRGAYICPAVDCWEKALKGKRLEHTLKIALTRENREELEKNGIELLKELRGS